MDKALVRGCEGLSSSRGGMNIQELREALIWKYPHYEQEISMMKRDELRNFCQNQIDIKSEIDLYKDYWFKGGSNLTELNKKYCRCLVHVSGKVNNPYAVCTKSVGREGSPKCFDEFDFNHIPKDELERYLEWKGKKMSDVIKS